jgi:riboflavin synthase
MFAGIIQAVGQIQALVWESEQSLRLTVTTPEAANWSVLGASIAHNGICLTVVGSDAASFDVQLSPETLACTTAGNWQVGDAVNLEPSLRLGDSIDGHLVFGHVDGVGQVAEIALQDGYWRITITHPPAMAPYLVTKGSVAVNGTSLTINQVLDNAFALMIIPHTWTHTTFSKLQVGDAVNIEVDMLARYVAKQLQFKDVSINPAALA